MARTKLSKLAQELGIETCLEFDAGLLVPEQRIRDLCFANKCGNYGNNYMCPPHIGSLKKSRLDSRNSGMASCCNTRKRWMLPATSKG